MDLDLGIKIDCIFEQIMTGMKTLAVLTVLALIGCGGPKSLYSGKDINVIESSKQTIHPGVQGSPSSVEYHISIVVSKGIESFGLCTVFDEKGKELNTEKIKVFKNGKPVKDGAAISKGDTLSLHTNYFIFHEEDETRVNVGFFKPLEWAENAEIMIEYVKKGEKRIFGIEKVSPKETVYMP